MSTLHPPPELSIVIPCYNEEEVIGETSNRLINLLETLESAGTVRPRSKIYFVDDGSRDTTWQTISELAQKHAGVHGLKLSRNRGHQTALLAGLLNAEGNVIISMDADLQDDIHAIKNMLREHANGKDIVYGVREARSNDTFFKKNSAEFYYRLIKAMGVDVVFNHADYRLMSRRAIEALKEYPESNLFLRGVIPTLGFPSAVVTYARGERFAGESKYPLRKMLALAIDGITSFTAFPLRIIAVVGLLVFIGSLLMSGWVLGVKLFTNNAVPGWASSVLPIYFLGGVQLLGIGVVGEYIAKIYAETKRRPRFFIEDSV